MMIKGDGLAEERNNETSWGGWGEVLVSLDLRLEGQF